METSLDRLSPDVRLTRTKKASVTIIVLYDLHAIGARSIRAYLRKKGYEVNIICLKLMVVGGQVYLPTQRELDLLFGVLDDLQSDVIGLSLCWSAAVGVAEFLHKEIKSRYDAPILVGGVHAIMDTERTSEWSDITCVGEGELAVEDVLKRVEQGRDDFEDIPDLWVRKGDTVIRNPKRPPLPNLDEFGIPDFDDTGQFFIDFDELHCNDQRIRQHGIYHTTASRGCPMQCTFCSSPMLRRAYINNGTFMRVRSVENVISEMHAAREKFGKRLRMVDFTDDIFGLNADWLDEFAETYRREIGISFVCFQHPMTANDRVIAALKRAGIGHIRIGLQSGSPRIRREIFKRSESNERIIDAHRLCRKHGVRPFYELITDIPWETEEDRQQTLEMVMQMRRPFRLHMYTLSYMPGTELTKRAMAEGITDEPYKAEVKFVRKALANGAPTEQVLIEQEVFRAVSPIQAYWRALIGLSVRRFVPRSFVRVLAKLPSLRQNPKPLVIFSRMASYLSNGYRGLEMAVHGQLTFATIRRYVGIVLRSDLYK